MRLIALLLLIFSLALPVTAQASDISGNWQRSNGQARVAFAPCHGMICGRITWLDPKVKTKARIGDKIFYDLVSDGADRWKGKAFSPKEGKTYSATLKLNGKILNSEECLLGDRICRSETWTRVN